MAAAFSLSFSSTLETFKSPFPFGTNTTSKKLVAPPKPGETDKQLTIPTAGACERRGKLNEGPKYSVRFSGVIIGTVRLSKYWRAVLANKVFRCCVNLRTPASNV